MRVLICTWGQASHLFPMVPLAWALRVAGHDVRIAGQPSLTPAVTNAGLYAVEVGGQVDLHAIYRARVAKVAAEGETAQLNLQHDPAMAAAFAQAAESMLSDLLVLAEQWRPDLVVYDSTTFAAPVLAALTATPVVRYVAQPDYFAHKSSGGWPGAGPSPSSALFAAHGVGDVRILDGTAVDTCPPSMQVPARHPRLPMRFVPYNGSGHVPGWVHEPPDRPRLCLTWGTTIGISGQRRFPVRAIVDAAVDVGFDVVIALSPNDSSMVEGLPPEVRIAYSLPLSAIMPSVDVLVGGGGGGTMMTALSFGVPQLHIPQVVDMPFNAERLASTGAGVAVESANADAGVLREHLAELIDPRSATRAAAVALQRENAAQPGLAETVTELERFVAEHRVREPVPQDA